MITETYTGRVHYNREWMMEITARGENKQNHVVQYTSVSLTASLWGCVRHLWCIQMWLAIMFLGSLALDCWYIRCSQQTAVKLLDLLNSHKTLIGFLFSWFLRIWEFFSTCSLFLWLSPTDKLCPAQMVGFKSCICLYETFNFLLLNFQSSRGLIKKMATKLIVQLNALLSFIYSKIFSILFLLHQNVCLRSFFSVMTEQSSQFLS